MAEKYQFTDNAKKQLKENFKYYNDKNPNAADEFIEDVYEKVNQIANKPESHSIVYEDVRKASLRKFPFFLYYAFRNTIVYILAVWHKKREQRIME